jgi:hypothetical protein
VFIIGRRQSELEMAASPRSDDRRRREVLIIAGYVYVDVNPIT